jgi:hypothetical protein
VVAVSGLAPSGLGLDFAIRKNHSCKDSGLGWVARPRSEPTMTLVSWLRDGFSAWSGDWRTNKSLSRGAEMVTVAHDAAQVRMSHAAELASAPLRDDAGAATLTKRKLREGLPEEHAWVGGARSPYGASMPRAAAVHLIKIARRRTPRCAPCRADVAGVRQLDIRAGRHRLCRECAGAKRPHLHCPTGKTTALVGLSGAGKTTTFNLMGGSGRRIRGEFSSTVN